MTDSRAPVRAPDWRRLHPTRFRCPDRAAGVKLGNALLKSRGQSVHVAGSLAVDRWQGDPRVQLRIIDVASADPVSRMGGT